MTKRVEGVVIVTVEGPRPCARCDQSRELRPCGPGGIRVCFDCSTPEERDAYVRRLFNATVNSAAWVGKK